MSVQSGVTNTDLSSGRAPTALTRAGGFSRRLLGRTDGLVGVAILLVFGLLALFPSLFVGPLENLTTSTGVPLQGPSAEHLFGTDELGRDMLNLTVHGARISMAIGLMATIVTIVIGALVGIVAGFVGGTAMIGLVAVGGLWFAKRHQASGDEP